ncbi:MAG TPA: MgtC/SapB family protein, partial [Rubellimicrobium sp.]|nr:MgtC/SapB family protein [Rubellimicrobium sp.]
DPAREGEVRAFLLRTFALAGLGLNEISVRPSTEGALLDITATVTGEGATPVALDQALARLAAEPGLARVSWQTVEDV